MAKKSRKANRIHKYVDHCVFCERKDLTETHIWPGWLNKLLQPPTTRLEELEIRNVPAPGKVLIEKRQKVWMGSPFTQKPYLCCKSCNTGWMKKFEDEMLKFSKPIFMADNLVSLDQRKRRVFSVWVALITILAEYIAPGNNRLCVSKGDRDFIKRFRSLPETWTVVACSQDSTKWWMRYRHHPLWCRNFESLSEYYNTVISGNTENNTQISNFGMGKIFVQTFNCPDLRQVENFRIFSRSAGLVQLWPPPGLFWPLKRRSPKFPTKLVLKDDEVDVIADAFYQKFQMLTQPPFWGRHLPRI